MAEATPITEESTMHLLVRSDLTFGLLLPGQIRTTKLKSAYNSLIIGPRGLGW